MLDQITKTGEQDKQSGISDDPALRELLYTVLTCNGHDVLLGDGGMARPCHL